MIMNKIASKKYMFDKFVLLQLQSTIVCEL